MLEGAEEGPSNHSLCGGAGLPFHLAVVQSNIAMCMLSVILHQACMVFLVHDAS